MPVPHLMIVAGTRSEVLACAGLVRRLRGLRGHAAPFEVRFVTTGQQDTELAQTLAALDLEADASLVVLRPHLGDANLDAALLDAMEAVVRHHMPLALLAAGCGSTPWAAAVTAYYKEIPFIHLGAGDFSPAGERPYPDWFHRGDITRIAQLHLCPDADCVSALQPFLAAEGVHLLPVAAPAPQGPWKQAAPRPFSAQTGLSSPFHPRVAAMACCVGSPADEALAAALEAPAPPDPALACFRADAPRVVAYMRRREHHANALRPFCEAFDALALLRSDTDFAVFHSLQSFICNVLAATLPRRENLRDLSPLPHVAFVRELARARAVVTDSPTLAREALLLGRPLVLIGAYSETLSLHALARSRGVPLESVAIGREAIVSAVSGELGRPAPPPAPPPPDAGSASSRALDALFAWWAAEER